GKLDPGPGSACLAGEGKHFHPVSLLARFLGISHRIPCHTRCKPSSSVTGPGGGEVVLDGTGRAGCSPGNFSGRDRWIGDSDSAAASALSRALALQHVMLGAAKIKGTVPLKQRDSPLYLSRSNNSPISHRCAGPRPQSNGLFWNRPKWNVRRPVWFLQS